MKMLDIQAAIYTRLASVLSVDVWDDVPQQPEFPYVVIGDDTAVDWSADAYIGTDATLTIHVWSRQSGRSETKAIQQEIDEALNRFDLVVDGLDVVTLHREFSQTMLDPDGRTRHGVQRFRLMGHE